MNGPLVSIVIPCYNVEKYLKDAVESAVQQTYRNIEIILVDDGSTDGTSELCDYFEKGYGNVRVIHKENGGLSSARNAGMADAKGEYIYFLDSDDFIKNIAIENLVHKMQEYNLDVILFGSENVNESGKVIDETGWITENDSHVYRGIEAFELFLKTDIYAACVPYYFYKKDFLDSFFLSFANGIIHEDEFFSFHVYRFARRIKVEKEKYYYRRIREGSIMTSLSNIEKKFESTVWITKTVVKECNLRQLDDGESKAVLLFMRRIQDLMCARFNEMTWAQMRSIGGEYRKCLRKYIVFAISKNQLEKVWVPLNRYIMSLYAFFKRDEVI